MVNAPFVANAIPQAFNAVDPAPVCNVPSTCEGEQALRYERTLRAALQRAQQSDALWIFGYASLIWRPEFDAEEVRQAQVNGWHRALRMRSRINRGSAERPGLVFALLNGGRCVGQAFRLPRHSAAAELPRLWFREMPFAAYEPRWLRCQTAQGPVQALAFTLPRQHPSHTGPIDDETLLNVLRHARGRYGSTLDYVLQTDRGLRSVGIHDAEIERMVRLARAAGLLTKDDAALPEDAPSSAASSDAPYETLREAASPA